MLILAAMCDVAVLYHNCLATLQAWAWRLLFARCSPSGCATSRRRRHIRSLIRGQEAHPLEGRQLKACSGIKPSTFYVLWNGHDVFGIEQVPLYCSSSSLVLWLAQTLSFSWPPVIRPLFRSKASCGALLSALPQHHQQNIYLEPRHLCCTCSAVIAVIIYRN